MSCNNCEKCCDRANEMIDLLWSRTGQVVNVLELTFLFSVYYFFGGIALVLAIALIVVEAAFQQRLRKERKSNAVRALIFDKGSH